MSEHYVPILKGKLGEFSALKELDIGLRDLLTPLVDIPRVPMASRHKPLDDHLAKMVDGIAQGWGPARAIFVDLFDIDLATRGARGEHPVSYVMRSLHSKNIEAVPVVGLDRDPPYIMAAREAAARVDSIVVRLLEEDIQSTATLASELDGLRSSLRIEPVNTHLLLDLRSMREKDVSYYVALVVRALRALPAIHGYASVVVAGSSVPQSLAEDVPKGSMGRIPRKELELWRRLRMATDIPRRPTFGDYGVVHPDNLDLDGSKLTLGADIRYTSGQDTLVLKGQSFKSHPDGYGQYHSLAKLLVAMPDFRGPKFSWGDWRLAKCARRHGGPGNKTTWVQVATSHHLAHVVDQLAAA